MDASLGSSPVSAVVGQVQSAVVEKTRAVNLASEGSANGGSAVNLVDSAQQTIDSLVNQPAGIGAILNVKA
jgi:hypothetical protein